MTHRPSHPGEILRDYFLEPFDLTATRVAKGLRVPRTTLSGILNERGRVSPAMAYKLAEAFGTSPEFWINLQALRDSWDARHTGTEGVERFETEFD